MEKENQEKKPGIDFNKLIADAEAKIKKETFQDAIEGLKKVIFNIFDANTRLTPEENIALAIDITKNATTLDLRNVITLWYVIWKKEREDSHEN